MAKFLLACYPIAGHLHPNIAVAHELRARGHEVAFYSGELARSTVKQEGFTYFPYDAEMDACLSEIWLPNKGPGVAANIPIMQRPLFQIKQIKTTMSDWFLRTVPQQVDDLRSIIQQWQPDILVTDVSLFGPLMVLHETEEIPVAAFSVLLACPLPGSDAPTWGRGLPPPTNWHRKLRSKVEEMIQNLILRDFRKEASELRMQYGLTPLSESVMASCANLPLFLVAGTPELDYNRRDLPPSVHYVGPCIWHRSQDERPPEWLANLPKDRPVVHVTEGTVHVGRPLVLWAAAQGLKETEMEVVMTTGKNRDLATIDLGPLSSNIRVESYVSHGDLLPHTDAVVTTGGPGTVKAALMAGVPLVIVATGWDHIENAQRVVDAGVGVYMDPKQCTPETLRVAVERVLKDPSYQRNAERIGNALKTYGDQAKTSTLLEGLLERPLAKAII